MITNDNKKLAQWAMEFALKNGCQSSRVTLYNGSSSSFEIRDLKTVWLSICLSMAVTVLSPPTAWIKRNWKNLSATESIQPVTWQKTRPVHCLTLPCTTKETVLTCN